MGYKQQSPIVIKEGGTNATSMTTTDGVVYFDGTSLVTTAVGTATHVLTSNGSGMAPTFQPAGGGGGGITTINGDTSSVTGTTVTITGQNTTVPYGQSLKFIGNGTTIMNVNLIDGGANFYAGSAATGSQLSGGINGSSNFLYGFQSSESLGSGGTSTANIIFGNNSLRSQAVAQTNVILGSQAAEFVSVSTTFDNNIMIGTLAGQFGSGTSVTNNIAIGMQALQNIIDSGAGFTNNIAIGTTAGAVLSGGSESNNILIAGLGLSGESGVIQLGAAGGPYTKTFIQGIASVAVSNTNMVTIDTTTGQLGSQAITGGNPAASCSFQAYLGTNETNATGNGNAFALGSNNALTIVYDLGSDFTTGGVFTAPNNGIYVFQMGCLVLANTTSNEILHQYLSSGGTNYDVRNNRTASADNFGLGSTTTLQLTAGETVTFSVVVSGNVGNTCTIQGAINNTWINGYQLS